MNEENTLIVRDTGLESVSTGELKSRLAAIMGTTAAGLRDMAHIVAVLESRGEDLTDLRLGMIEHLRRIAAGQLLPEVVVRCAGQPRMLNLAIRLTIPDQQRLSAGSPFDLAVWRGDQIEWRLVDPLEATGSQLSQMFAADHVRTKQEQVSVLEHRREIALRAPVQETVSKGKLRVDKVKGVIVLNKTSFTVAQLLEAMAQLGSVVDDDAELETTCIFKVTADEHRKLKQMALDGNTTQQMLVRRAIRACGLI